MTAPDREQQRYRAIAQLGLLEVGSVPVFEEATQTAAYFLQAPICILSIVDRDRQWFKAAVGLSRLGLMNELAANRSLPRRESFCTQVVENRKAIAISDCLTDPTTSDSVLVQHYGIRAYLSVPIFTSSGDCIGTLAVMDLEARNFAHRDIEYLELTARWSISEFERNRLLKETLQPSHPSGKLDPLLEFPPDSEMLADPIESPIALTSPHSVNQQTTAKVKIDLLHQLTQELRTPLTSVMGMASVLSRETFGPLTHKQKEYLDIIHYSGEYLLSLVNEILELGITDLGTPELKIVSVDIEMLCQQAINSLEQTAKRREQTLRLSVEPGNRIWLLDKTIVRQILYHLVSSVIESATAESIIRLHVSRKNNGLNMTVWVSHPWLGEGLLMNEVDSAVEAVPVAVQTAGTEAVVFANSLESVGSIASEVPLDSYLSQEQLEEGNPSNSGGENLRLTLSHLLVFLHGGHISMQGSVESGYRYVVTLPDMAS